MNDLNKNTRTLIVSFVIAIMFLVPLRFVEVGQGLVDMTTSNSQVLGEVNEVIEAKLEAPYDKLESQSCIDKSELDKLENKTLEKIQQGQLSAVDKSILLGALKDVELKACN
ncbi:MAG: hypothetical protein WC784_03540 [Candidatus Shapirobacteria bacterium]|jgi:hypothetical protein